MENSRRKITRKNDDVRSENAKRVNNKTNKKDDVLFKNVLIIVLLIICFIQAIYIVFYTLNLKENTVKKSFLMSYINFQKEITEYLIEEKANMYDAYNYSQILTGTVIDESGNINNIKDIDGNNLTPVVNLDSKLDINGAEYYAINNENINSILEVSIPSYKNMIWYLSSNGDVKIKLENKPKWWTSDLDCVLLGN